MGITSDLIFIVLAALSGAIFALLLKQPMLVGYVLAGILIGPYTGGVTVQDRPDIERLSEIGVALLLFTLGLEFSFRHLKPVLFISSIGTLIQLVVCTACGFGLSHAIGLEWREAIWVGCIISVSSTMTVLKTLISLGVINSLSSKIMLGMLIVQDLAIIPMMLILPQITHVNLDFSQLYPAIIKSALFVAFMYFAGTRVFPKMFKYIASMRSRELFFLFTLAIALGIGYLTYQLGLSFPFGAFAAGIVLSETDFRHQALSDVTSLRDLFGLIFFVSVGMLLDPHFLLAEWKIIGSFLVCVLIIKTITTYLVVRCFNYRGDIPLMVGIGLSQIGEFSFVIGSSGLASGHISQETYSLIISVTVLSMILTPIFFRIAKAFSTRRSIKPMLLDKNSEVSDKEGHVVVVGGGIVGTHIAKVLTSLQVESIIIEIDHYRALELRKRSYKVIFGDAMHQSVLRAAGVQRAKLVVIASSNLAASPVIVRQARSLQSEIRIVARVDNAREMGEILRLGIKEVVEPKLEASLELVRQALLGLGTEERAILKITNLLREQNYSPSSLNKL